MKWTKRDTEDIPIEETRVLINDRILGPSVAIGEINITEIM
jgi:hypothetical protein